MATRFLQTQILFLENSSRESYLTRPIGGHDWGHMGQTYAYIYIIDYADRLYIRTFSSGPIMFD